MESSIVDGNPLCTVPNCKLLADYEVINYRVTDYPDEVLTWRDDDGPYLCAEHMQADEAPHGPAEYSPRSRGRTYDPLEGRHTLLYAAPNRIVAVNCADLTSELVAELRQHPDRLWELGPRQFEEFVASLFRNNGFEVELTPPTRDGGVDLWVARKEPVGSQLYAVECKRYRSTRRVGVEVVRGVYGVVASKQATGGVVVTTSTFTKDAVTFAKPLEYRLALRDYDALVEWLRGMRGIP